MGETHEMSREERDAVVRDLLRKNQPVSETYESQIHRMLGNAIDEILTYRRNHTKP